MRHGWVYIYESPPAPTRCEELLDQLELQGISLADPNTGRVIRLSPIGEQISSSREDILRESARSTRVSFNLYFAPSDNLYCSIEKLNDEVCREGYSLDGKTELQSLSVIDSLLHLFAKRADNGAAFALVVDRFAELSMDFHWDDFIIGDVGFPPEWPMVLAFSRNFKKTGVVPRHEYDIEEFPQYTLFRRKLGELG